MPVTTLCPRSSGLASSWASDLNPPKLGAHLAGVDSAASDRVQAGLDEGARDLFGQRLGALIGPDEVVTDRGGHRVLEFGADLGPVQGRVAAVDHAARCAG